MNEWDHGGPSVSKMESLRAAKDLGFQPQATTQGSPRNTQELVGQEYFLESKEV